MRDVRTLPKAHLHLHTEASARPATIVELAAKYGVAYEVPTAFADFADFGAAYQTMVEFIQEPADLARICREIVEDEAAEGVLYSQPMFAPAFYSAPFGMTDAEVFDLMRDAFLEAATRCDIEVGFILAGLWTQPVADVEAAAQFAAERVDQGVVAFGLAGPEPAGGHEQYIRACAVAREAGLLIVPHAGEFGGPANVAAAVDVLAADRIAHGVRAVEDPAVVSLLAERRIACDVCPTSNVVLGVYASMAEHPVATLLDAGVPVTLNSDDQLFFGSLVAGEYATVRDALGLSDAELAAIARTSADVSGASLATRARIHDGIDVWLASPA
jgi:adenosine deaminase